MARSRPKKSRRVACSGVVMIASLEQVAGQLNKFGVRFIVIGGWAAIIHGSAHNTNDVDVVYARDPENLRRLVEALTPWKPYLRGAPPGLPFRFDRSEEHTSE